MRKKPELRDLYRDVRTGEFVTEREHQKRPNTIEHERRPVPSPTPEHRRHPKRPKNT